MGLEMRSLVISELRTIYLATAAVGILAAVPSAAWAQDAGAATSQDAEPGTAQDQSDGSTQGDIIVTAQRRSERLQSVPIAITALSSEAIANQGITNLEGLSTAAPSLKVVAYPNSSDTLTLTMRGQGAGDVGQITRDGGVGLYVDGFYIGRPQGALLDLGEPERIEVLRGPQGTLYGRNTTGGAINIITKKPTGEWGGSGSFTYGSRNLLRSVATVDVPLAETFAVKGSVVYVSQDGWVENVNRARNFGEFNQIAGKIAAKWTPTADLTINYSYDQGEVNTTPLYFINPALEGAIPGYFADKDRTYAPLDLDYSKTEFVDHQLTIEYALNDAITLRSLTAYRGFRADQDINYGLAQSTPTFPLTVEQDAYYRTRQYSQELQLIGDVTERLDFTGGLFFYREKGRHDNFVNLGYVAFGINSFTDARVDALSKSYAAYAQSTWNLPVFEDRIKLTVGGRYTKDKRRASRDFVNNGTVTEVDVTNRQSFSNFSPMANLAVQWTPDIMTYVKFSKGYKAGGSAEGAPDFTQTFGPEKVTAWEAGIKTQLFDRLLTFNATAFYNKFDDIQIDFVADPLNTSVVATYNAGKANIKGIEVESTLQPSPDFSLRGSFSYLKPELKRVDALAGTIFDGPFAVGTNIAGYFTLPFVPKYAWSVGGDWTFLRLGEDELSVHGTYSYQSPVYTSSGAGPLVPGRNFYRNDPVKNMDARINWVHPIPAGKAITFSVFADNLFDNRRSDFIIGVGGTALTGYQSSTAPYNEPRTIGGEVKIEF
jgi:iron complex outermembrane recepter protein